MESRVALLDGTLAPQRMADEAILNPPWVKVVSGGF
jgi:hypothetical protein